MVKRIEDDGMEVFATKSVVSSSHPTLGHDLEDYLARPVITSIAQQPNYQPMRGDRPQLQQMAEQVDPHLHKPKPPRHHRPDATGGVDLVRTPSPLGSTGHPVAPPPPTL